MTKLNLVILGGGNGPHCYAAIAAELPDVEVRVLTLYEDEAERWTKAMDRHPFEVTFNNWEPGKDRVFSGKPALVSKDPAKTLKGAHLIVFMVPSFAHAQYFGAIKPHLEDGVIVCGAPGSCGFVFQAVQGLGSRLKTCSLLAFESLPWACRLTEFGRSATVLAGKDLMKGAAIGDVASKTTVLGMSVVDTIEYTLVHRPKLVLKGHLLADTLMTGGCIHAGINYGMWSVWDGKPLKEKPDFYNGTTRLGAEMVTATNLEVLNIRDAVVKARPDVDLSTVVSIYEWYCYTYPNEIEDTTDLYSVFHTHKGYNGIKHPMIAVEGGFVPDFKYRYFTQDIPCGQVVLKGIAEIAGVPTPNIDKVIMWAQEKMGKEYLVDGKLTGKDLGESRCPQRFGITTLDGMLGYTS